MVYVDVCIVWLIYNLCVIALVQIYLKLRDFRSHEDVVTVVTLHAYNLLEISGAHPTPPWQQIRDSSQ